MQRLIRRTIPKSQRGRFFGAGLASAAVMLDVGYWMMVNINNNKEVGKLWKTKD